MRKYFAIVLAAVAAIACQKEINGPEVKGVFTASVESYDETKTFTDATLQVKWSKGDYLNIWEHKRTSDKYTISAASVGKNYADLELVKAGSSSGFVAKLPANIGFYPYSEEIACSVDGDGYKLENIVLPATQKYVAGSFGNGALPMVAVTSGENDYDLTFRNVCGVLRIVLTGTTSIKSISVTGNNNEVLCGKAEICSSKNSTPTIKMIGDGKTVTLNCGNGVNVGTGTSFDIVLPPVTFEKGFTINVNGDSDAYYKTDKPHTIKRSHILCMQGKTIESNDYLKFTSEGSTTIALKRNSSPFSITLLYLKGTIGDWKSYTIGDEIALNDGESVFFKAGDGGNSLFSLGYDNKSFYSFSIGGEGKIRASGNIMSLMDAKCESVKCSRCCFQNLFGNCTNLVTAPDLPATTLAPNCYEGMFWGCTGLTSVPKLPALTLADHCYLSMFYGCTGLKSTPELPAETLADYCYMWMFAGCTSLTSSSKLPAMTLAPYCYEGMFSGCSSLTLASELPATTLAKGCYHSMFAGCAALTTAPKISALTMAEDCCSQMFSGCTSLTTISELTATTLASSCYNYMFNGCTSLTTAPKLPAIALESSCYFEMFNDCTALTTAPELPATNLASNCYSYMFSGCTSLTTAPALSATTLANHCYWGMFNGCTSLTTAPELPATALTESCYWKMFYGCSKLSYIKMMAIDISATRCLNDWVNGVSPTGTFVKNAAATWDVRGTSGIPEGWTIDECIYTNTLLSNIGDFTIDNKTKPEALAAVWTQSSSYGMVATGYNNTAKVNYDSESWLVSPVIDLTSQSKAYLEFDHACNFFSSIDVVPTQATVWARVENGEWAKLEGVKYPTALSWSYTTSGSIDLSAYTGKKMQFAFVYKSTSAKAGTWMVKNVKIVKVASQQGGGSDGGSTGTVDATWIVSYSNQTWTAGTDATYGAGYSATVDGITVGYYKASSTSTAVAPSSDHIRVYKSSALKITSTKTLTKVVMTCTGSDKCLDLTGVCTSNATANTSDLTITWTGSAKDIVLLANEGQVRITKIEFYTSD